MLGAEFVAKSVPDGYTVLLASTGSLAAAPARSTRSSRLRSDQGSGCIALRDACASGAVINPKLPVKNLAELIALAKSQAGQADHGIHGQRHVESPRRRAVAADERYTAWSTFRYKRASSQAINDLLGGQVDLMFDNLPSSLTFIKGGQLRALGRDRRVAQQRAAAVVHPFLRPACRASRPARRRASCCRPGRRKEIVQKMDAALAKALASPKVRSTFVDVGADVSNLPSEEFAALMRGRGGEMEQGRSRRQRSARLRWQARLQWSTRLLAWVRSVRCRRRGRASRRQHRHALPSVRGPRNAIRGSTREPYTPAPAPLTAYLEMCAALGITRTVQVNASVYGFDNRLTLDAIAKLGQHRARGRCRRGPGHEPAELERLHLGGMRGVRLSTHVAGYGGTELAAVMAARLKPLGWHVQLHVADGAEIATLEAAS
jgi:tripartite-type tricarboxylate transporter receptor subunit TctC